jgi:acyl carrier protein
MTESMTLGIREFADLVQREYELDRAPNPSDRLIEDLGFDSLRLFDLVMFVFELANVNPQGGGMAFPVLETFDDAFTFFGSVTSPSSGEGMETATGLRK